MEGEGPPSLATLHVPRYDGGCSNAGFCCEVQDCGPPYCFLALNKWSWGCRDLMGACLCRRYVLVDTNGDLHYDPRAHDENCRHRVTLASTSGGREFLSQRRWAPIGGDDVTHSTKRLLVEL